jgi:predicted anti-sigma-YlaC factor YlaD
MCRGRIVTWALWPAVNSGLMDIVSVVVAIAAFAVLLLLVGGIDRI